MVARSWGQNAAAFLARKNSEYLLYFSLFALFCLVLLNATVAEDAYITFRVLDQYANGNGLKWNIDERVQVYTHPLWMLLHIPFYNLWRNIFFVTLFICLVCTAVAVWLPIRTWRRPAPAILVLFILPLLFSRTFIDYSTSGLENPLMHALFAWFGWVLLRARPERFWFWVTFVVALSLTTRLDTVILYAPAGLYLLFTHFRIIRWRQVFLGALPIVLWEIFSLFYYGFPFPNTKYAKLDTGIGASAYIAQGWRYFKNLVATDTLSALWLLAACALIPWLVWRYIKSHEHITGIFCAIALGIFSYSLYIISIGGWHTYGRYWSLPVFASIWLLATVMDKPLAPKKWLWFGAALCLIKLSVPTFHQWQDLCPRCFDNVHLQKIKNHVALKDYVQDKKTLPKPHARRKKKKVTVGGQIGKFGYTAPLDVIIIDNWALCDPLLSRLPARSSNILLRQLPPGYRYARKTGDTSEMDADLARYYEKLRLIVAGDLWDWERLEEIVKFNLGHYEHLRLSYLRRMRKQDSSRDD